MKVDGSMSQTGRSFVSKWRVKLNPNEQSILTQTVQFRLDLKNGPEVLKVDLIWA